MGSAFLSILKILTVDSSRFSNSSYHWNILSINSCGGHYPQNKCVNNVFKCNFFSVFSRPKMIFIKTNVNCLWHAATHKNFLFKLSIIYVHIYERTLKRVYNIFGKPHRHISISIIIQSIYLTNFCQLEGKHKQIQLSTNTQKEEHRGCRK